MTIEIKRPPLSAMMHHPIEDIKRLGLTVEGSHTAGLEEMRPYADVLATAHGPFKLGSMRLNPAATEEDFREESIKIIEDFIDMTTAFPELTQINLHFGCVRRVDPEQTRGREGRVPRPGRSVPAHRRLRRPAGQGDRAGELRGVLDGRRRRDA